MKPLERLKRVLKKVSKKNPTPPPEGYKTASEARTYIEAFKLQYYPAMGFVDFGPERIWLDKMTDEEAIRVANGLLEIEREGTKRIPRQ